MKRNGNIWPKVLLGVIGVGASIWIIMVSLGAAATREWEAYAASLRAKGQPITFDEIEAQRANVPDAINSARIVEGLAAKINAEVRGQPTLGSFTSSGSQAIGDFFSGIHRGRIETARTFLDSYRETLTGLEEIRHRPTGRYTIEYDRKNPIATLVPHTGTVRNASKLLMLDSTIKLADGHREDAIRNIELQGRLAGTLSDEPMLISRLVQIAVQAVAIQTVEAVLRTGTLDESQLTQVAKELRAMRASGTLRWALLGERAFFIESCDALAAGRVSLPTLTNVAGSQPSGILGLPIFINRSNQLRGAQMHTSLIEAIDNPGELLAAARKLEVDIPNLSRIYVLVKILMPSLTRAIVLHARISAQLDSAIAALAAEQFRMAKGRLPNSLEELLPDYLPAIPTDPFDGNPLRLAKTQTGIVIYSVHENGIDDGGDVSAVGKGKSRLLDIGFRLNHVDHRGIAMLDDSPAED